MPDCLCGVLWDGGLWSYFIKTTVLDGRFSTPGRCLRLVGEDSWPGENVTPSACSNSYLRSSGNDCSVTFRSSTSIKSEFMLSIDSTNVGSIENEFWRSYSRFYATLICLMNRLLSTISARDVSLSKNLTSSAFFYFLCSALRILAIWSTRPDISAG